MREATYTYDEVGNRTAVVDYNGHATYFQYDALNRLSAEIDPLGGHLPGSRRHRTKFGEGLRRRVDAPDRLG